MACAWLQWPCLWEWEADMLQSWFSADLMTHKALGKRAFYSTACCSSCVLSVLQAAVVLGSSQTGCESQQDLCAAGDSYQAAGSGHWQSLACHCYYQVTGPVSLLPSTETWVFHLTEQTSGKHRFADEVWNATISLKIITKQSPLLSPLLKCGLLKCMYVYFGT